MRGPAGPVFQLPYPFSHPTTNPSSKGGSGQLHLFFPRASEDEERGQETENQERERGLYPAGKEEVEEEGEEEEERGSWAQPAARAVEEEENRRRRKKKGKSKRSSPLAVPKADFGVGGGFLQ